MEYNIVGQLDLQGGEPLALAVCLFLYFVSFLSSSSSSVKTKQGPQNIEQHRRAIYTVRLYEFGIYHFNISG